MKRLDSSSLQLVEKTVSRVIELSASLGVIILGAMMLLTVADVILRYFFNSPINGSAEYTRNMMVAVGFLGLAWSALKGGHIKVDLVVGKMFSQRGQAVIDSINHLVVLGLSILLGSQALSQSMVVRHLQLKSTITGIPVFPFYLIVTFGFIMLLLASIILLVHSISKVVKG